MPYRTAPEKMKITLQFTPREVADAIMFAMGKDPTIFDSSTGYTGEIPCDAEMCLLTPNNFGETTSIMEISQTDDTTKIFQFEWDTRNGG
jgi:hypothetical protein